MDIRPLIEKRKEDMLKIGVVGAGHLGKIHLKCIQNLAEQYQLVGFFDSNPETNRSVAKTFQVPSFESYDSLIAACDVIDIVAPTSFHFELAMKAVSAGKHLFIEKPIVSLPDEAKTLVHAAKQKGIKVQVGHVERYNPAFLAMKEMDLQPMFIEAHRLAPFNPRGTDVSVVLDLMIHDLDIVLNIVKSPVTNLHASGVSVVSKESDICNARLQFENGCVANLTASRISLKQMRKLRIFQPNAYVSMDFLEKESQIIQLKEEAPEHGNAFELPLDSGTKWLDVQIPEALPVNAIEEELKSLHRSIMMDVEPEVTASDAAEALQLAFRILDAIQSQQKGSIKA